MSGKIIVASAVLPERKWMGDILRRAGFQVTAETSDFSHTLRRIRSLYCDVLIVDNGLDGGKGTKLAEIVIQDQLAAVILMVDNDVPHLDRQCHYLIKPVNNDILVPSVESALWYWQRESGLRDRIRGLEEKLETRIVMDKAKGLLMDVHGWSESEAHRFIQKEAMNNSITLRQVALSILERMMATNSRTKS